MKNIILAGNWKMNMGPQQAQEFLSRLTFATKQHARMRIYAPYLSLSAALAAAKEKNTSLEIGAQNIHYEKSGAFTGEISGPMLQEIGINQALIGHSERRQYFNETNETALKRVESALSQNFEVLLCIGETLQQRQSNATEVILNEQLDAVLKSTVAHPHWGSRLNIAYEPVWAIGTGVVATPEQAEAAHAFIRNRLSTVLGKDAAQKTRLLYGGSVAPNNFKELLSCPNIDGGLVGGASLKLETWQSLWDLV
jgi:triosephosphate isomerase